MTTTNNQDRAPTQETDNQPHYVALTAKGESRKSKLERIGVAWNREDGGIGIRLTGTQIIGSDIYLYPIDPASNESAQ